MEANIIGLMVECAKLFVILCGCMNLPIKRKPIAAIVVFALAQACLVVKGMQDREYCVSTFLLLSIVICSLAVQSRKKWLYAIVSYFGISCIDTLFSTIAIRFFSISEDSIYSASVERIIVNALSLVFLIPIALLLQRLYYRKKKLGKVVKNAVQQSSSLCLCLLAIGLSAALWFTMPITRPSLQWSAIEEDVLWFTVYIFIVIFLAVGILLIFYHRSSNHYQELAKMNQNLLESKERYYQMVLEKEEETRRFRHDMSSHIICVKQLLREENMQGAKVYLEELSGVLGELRLKHQTGNTLVNVIVNDMCAKYSEVVLDWQGFLPAKSKLSDMDMCTIFSNLLENAFYAASGCGTGGKVDVTVKSVAGALSVIIENDRAGKVEEEKGSFLTQKEDRKNHGFGTRNVKDCVAKNEGIVDFEYTEDRFRVTITLINVV